MPNTSPRSMATRTDRVSHDPSLVQLGPTDGARRPFGGSRSRLAAAVIAAVLPIALAACGSSGSEADDSSASVSATGSSSSAGSSGSSDSASSSPAPADWADCEDVWVDGATLPKRYQGCAADGVAVPADKVACSSGQSLIIYGDHFYAVAGGTITETKKVLRNSPVYTKSVATCRG
ncbi:MAG: hypothetical protein QM638_07370 [Nocardioides sp.]|uniref:hypothetical protein n=1 Tax=Nocardioides sp. TaxID=35761 RepID=UPI0039E5435A